MHVDRTIEKSGFFFTPNNPEKRYPGVVTVTDGGRIDLEITADEVAFVELDEIFIGRLIGEVEGGFVTLEGCEYRKMNAAFGGLVGKSLIYARLILIGSIGLPETAAFTSFRFSVDNLSEWFGKSAFKTDYGQNFEGCTITLERPAPVQCLLPDGSTFVIDIQVRLPGAITYPIIELYQQAFIEIKPAQSQPYEYYQNLSSRITRFFAFLIGRPVAIHSLTAQVDDPAVDDIHKQVDVYFQSLNNAPKKPLKSWEMLLGHSSIAPRLSELLSSWLNEYENLTPALHHYFSVQDESHAFADTKFLALAQSLEAFHRRTSKAQKRLPKEIYKAQTRSILQSCPEEHRDWLKEKLNFGNEITFGERLRHLSDRFIEVFGGQSKVDLMVQGTVKTRNYHAHYDPAGKAKALTGPALITLTFRLRVLFALNLLVRLGLTYEEATKLTKAPPLQQLLRSAIYIEQNSD